LVAPARVDLPPDLEVKAVKAYCNLGIAPRLISFARKADFNEGRKLAMAIRLGDTAPDFTAETTEGQIKFHDWLGDSWGVLFSHPKDFTPVCTTELGEAARLKPEFDRRNVKIIGLSVDPADSHSRWAEDIRETQGTALNFPVIADADRQVSDLYDMIHPNASDTFTVRSVYVIGPDKKVKLMITYPASTGRNFDEILRVIDSLQLTANYSVATPVNWKDGDDCIIVPALSDEQAKEKFPAGWKTLKPYLRVTPQPNKKGEAQGGS
jgi:thioredoxin-dependent peroxiredoxin